MMIAARNAFFMGGGGPTPWVNPYITDGLVAMWDGEWNVAGQGGKNNPRATDWPALIGGGTWGTGAGILYNATNHCYDTNGAAQSSALRFTFPSAIDISSGAIEIVVRGISATGNYIKLAASDAGGNFITIHNGALLFYSFGSSAMTLTTNEIYSLALAPDNTYQRRQYVNGLPAATPAGGSYTVSYLAAPAASANAVRGELYALRVYNRRLTAAEVAANYAVDAARFGL